MLAYTTEENNPLDARTSAADAPIRYEIPTPEMLRHYVREGERLRAETIASFWARGFAAVGRGLTALKDAILIDTSHSGRHA